MPGQISQPNIYVTFPGNAPIAFPTDSCTIDLERISSVVPLPGNTEDGGPRLFWVDLGMATYAIVLQGVIKDFSPINPFIIAEKFMRSWKNTLVDISTNVDVTKLTQVQIDDATWGRLNYYCLNSKFDLTRTGGEVKWEYYMRFAVVVPPSIGYYGSFVEVNPLDGLPSVHLGFPVAGRQTVVQVDRINIAYDRQATTIPLPGNDDLNIPQVAYTDLGLAQPIMTLDGTFPDIMRPNPFEVMEAFYRNWSGRTAGDSRDNDHVEGLLGMCLDDPGGTRAFFGVPQKMTLTRRGGSSSWKHRISMWITRADESGV